jgi:hypothetical protein
MPSTVSQVLPALGKLSVALAVFGVVSAGASSAFATSLKVQMACANDYFAHCSAFSPSSPQVRSCMRAVGARLSKPCISALIDAGEVSRAEVARHRSLSETAAR